MTASSSGACESRKTLLIAPGQRADVLVQAGAPGTYEFRGLPYDQGHPSPIGPLARVVVAGDPMPMKLPAALPKPPFETIRDSEITGRRTLTFSAIAPEADAAGHWQEFSFLVDGKKFDPNRIDQRVKLGAVEEWTIVNTHFRRPRLPHPHQPVPGHAGERPAGSRTCRGATRSSCRAMAAASCSARASSTTPASSCCTVT